MSTRRLPASRPTSRAYYSTKESFKSLFFCGCKNPAYYEDMTPIKPLTEPLNHGFIPLNRWCRENFYTRWQARTLIRKRHLWILQDKSRIYVKENPFNPIPDKC